VKSEERKEKRIGSFASQSTFSKVRIHPCRTQMHLFHTLLPTKKRLLSIDKSAFFSNNRFAALAQNITVPQAQHHLPARASIIIEKFALFAYNEIKRDAKSGFAVERNDKNRGNSR